MELRVKGLADFIADTEVTADVLKAHPHLAHRFANGDRPPEYWTAFDKFLRTERGAALFALSGEAYKRLTVAELQASASEREVEVLKAAGWATP
jgi:hypothetical protein